MKTSQIFVKQFVAYEAAQNMPIQFWKNILWNLDDVKTKLKHWHKSAFIWFSATKQLKHFDFTVGGL